MKARSTVFLAVVLACFLGLSGSAFAAAPPNDAFASAEGLPNNSLVDGTIVEATAQPPNEGEHGEVAASHSVWYSFTPANPGQATVAVYSGDFTPVATVYSGATLSGLTKVADSSEFETKEEEFGGVNEKYFELTFEVLAAQKYSIAVDTGNGAVGGFEIGVAEPPPPLVATNDDFADVEPLSIADSAVGTTVDATPESGEGTHAGVAASHSVWYGLTPTKSGRTSLYVRGGFEPAITVYTGSSLKGLSRVVDSVEFIPYDPKSEGGLAEVAFDAVGGQEYKVAVDIRSGTPDEFEIGSYQLDVEPNDSFATPVILSGDSAHSEGNTNGASNEANEPAHSGYGPYSSLWFSWTAGSNGQTTINTAGSEIDTRLGVYTGSALIGLTPVAENDDVSESNLSSAVTFEATAGTTYRIVVDNGYKGQVLFGQFALALAHTPAASPPPPAGGGATAIDTAVKAPKSVKLKGKAKKAKVTLKLSSATAGASFECSVDHGSFKSCPTTFAVSLKKGKHTIEVRAKAADGSLDATPATATVTVKPAPKPKHKKKH